MKTCFRLAALPLCLLLLCAVPLTALAADHPPEPAMAALPDSISELISKVTLPEELMQTLQEAELDGLLTDLKPLLAESSTMSDAELQAALERIMHSHGITLVDEQLQQLCSLCRTLEKLSPEEVSAALEALRSKAEAVRDSVLPDTEANKTSPLRAALQMLVSLLRRLADWIKKLLDGLFALLKR